jgi:hypothetical protein
LIQPEELAATLNHPNQEKPVIVFIGFDFLFRAAHIPGSLYFGPGSRVSGVESLRRWASGVKKDRAVVLYCGCCPWRQCPNVRPAFQAVRQAGLKRVKVLYLPDSFIRDWVDKGYPVEKNLGQPLAEVGMGLKDRLAKSAGVGAYGAVMGREAVKSGLALGRTLYLGHGTRATASDVFVFEDDDHMKAEGFTLYCADPLHMPPAEDSSELSKQTRAAGIALAAHCSFTAAHNFMKEANAATFSRSMGDSVRTEMSELNLDITSDMVDRYIWLPRPAGVTRILDMEEPGTNDIFSVYLQEINKQNGTVGFRRRGVLGFDTIAVPLAEEIVKTISAATQKFGW